MSEGQVSGGLAFSRDGKAVVASGGGGGRATINYWDIGTAKVTKSFVHEGGVMTLTQGWLVTRDFPDCMTLWIYDLETRTQVAKFAGLSAKVKHAAVSPDGKHLAIQDGDNVLKVMEIPGGKELFKLDYRREVSRLYFLHNEPKLAVLSNAGFGIYDIGTGKAVGPGFFRTSAVSYDGKMLVSRGPQLYFGDKTKTLYPDGVHIYSREKKKIIATLDVDTTWKSIATQFTPDNRKVISAGANDGTVRIWDVSKLEP
jgi:WD40 repeat protein